MSCSNCYDLCTVRVNGHQAGPDDFTIGSITDTSTDVLVLFENVGSGRIHVQEVTTDGSGNVVVNLRKGYLIDGQSFRVRVTEAYYGQAYKAITPPSGGSTTYTCLLLTTQKNC